MSKTFFFLKSCEHHHPVKPIVCVCVCVCVCVRACVCVSAQLSLHSCMCLYIKVLLSHPEPPSGSAVCEWGLLCDWTVSDSPDSTAREITSKGPRTLDVVLWVFS